MSSALTITGGVPLQGTIKVRGAKNLVPKAMVAALLGATPSTLRNVPHIKDVQVVTDLLSLHGVAVDNDGQGKLHLDPSNVVRAQHADIDAHAGDSRIPILLCGPLLHTLGEAFIPDLGGCRIGDRPIDFHLEILRQFGAGWRYQRAASRTAARLPSGSMSSVPHPRRRICRRKARSP